MLPARRMEGCRDQLRDPEYSTRDLIARYKPYEGLVNINNYLPLNCWQSFTLRAFTVYTFKMMHFSSNIHNIAL